MKDLEELEEDYNIDPSIDDIDWEHPAARHNINDFSDGEMIIFLHDSARFFNNNKYRIIADRLSSLLQRK